MVNMLNSIRIDMSTLCQLRCPCCDNSRGKINKIIGKGFLKFKDFKKFVDKHPEINLIELSNWGEIFLNPELKKILSYANFKKITLQAYNGVNLNTVTDEQLEALTLFNVEGLSVSIDGATNETYKRYRINGNLNIVLENIRKINKYKRKYNSDKPNLQWQFIIFEHNLHEIPIAKKLAHELNMKFILKLNYNPNFFQVNDYRELGKITNLKIEDINDYKNEVVAFEQVICSQMWDDPQINWDGKLLGCCVNINRDYGNVFENDIYQLMEGEAYRYAIGILKGKNKPRNDIPCSTCGTYLNSNK